MAVGIILLFVGTCIIPAIAQDTEKPLPSSRGNWLYVGGSGPGNYTKIWDAINASSNGDTVFVYDDSSPYIENIFITTSISLIGENKITTIIKPSYHYDAISIRTSNVTIREFTINCETVGGDCISTYDSPAPANYITISDNILLNGGNGISLLSRYGYYDDYNVVVENTISRCGRGILLSSYIRYATISKNIITNNGESLLLSAQYVTISYNIFTMNEHGLFIEDLQDGVINNNTISNIQSGGVYLHGNNITTRNNYIEENMGYGIMIDGSYNVMVKDNNIINNSGKGIDIQSSLNIEITRNNLKGNSKGSFIVSESNKGVKIFQNNIIENRRRFVYFTFVPLLNEIVILENFWNNVQFQSKILFGIFGVVILPGHHTDWGYYPPLYLPIPGFMMDTKPAKEPYDIGR